MLHFDCAKAPRLNHRNWPHIIIWSQLRSSNRGSFRAVQMQHLFMPSSLALSKMNEQLHNYKLTIAYDGTAYSGWQIQPNGISIQEIIQEKSSLIARYPISLIGSGRTDAGVHALGQIAHFHCPQIPDLHKFQHSLNALIPLDIRILQIEEVPFSFHAQHHAIGKTYHYHLHLDRIPDPFKRLYSWHFKEAIDLNLLQEAASLFLGTHDFTSFANQAHQGSAAKDPVRTLYRLDVLTEPGGVRLEFAGSGFLYKMVRNILGILIEIASNKRPKEDIPIILAAKDRRKAGQAAPPQGLFLVKVDYPK
jgi:tRNA pseudouridine38-40 synthase